MEDGNGVSLNKGDHCNGVQSEAAPNAKPSFKKSDHAISDKPLRENTINNSG